MRTMGKRFYRNAHGVEEFVCVDAEGVREEVVETISITVLVSGVGRVGAVAVGMGEGVLDGGRVVVVVVEGTVDSVGEVDVEIDVEVVEVTEGDEVVEVVAVVVVVVIVGGVGGTGRGRGMALEKKN